MTGSEGAREVGREGQERSEASRSSRRVQGLLPEEQESLEKLEKTARKSRAAKRKAAREAKSAAGSETTAEAGSSGAHQVTPDEASDEVSGNQADLKSTDSVRDPVGEDESNQDESEEASAGGADKVEPPAEDRVSDSPQPEEEVEALDSGVPTIKEEDVIDLTGDDRAEGPTEEVSGALEALMTEGEAKTYVADQVRRWERDESESVPPTVKTDWTPGSLDSGSYVSAALMTSVYLDRRMAMASQADAWISEMQLKRVSFGAAQDLNAVLIPPGLFFP
ncbi:hypothetical protein PHYSODRAFT_256194 [Phytophthora sojae]|uniref:Uncharacterized protein n=1 Tax=Phytophthora sojae (strain P6497) TaxID=1094619 RepID=G4ZQZ7_PHYSP|nr:hypothetical protein PHYSODRAFT_256194 [Phytophthora sojae]EGZ14077.1 hypothetical protein PHYSODRAFT_256194 [Phytophthora sojae]|eukprot:XP_009531506.1 hypothetical protein PHYSODRAFT_256194 [Phytophthora sojae]